MRAWCSAGGKRRDWERGNGTAPGDGFSRGGSAICIATNRARRLTAGRSGSATRRGAGTGGRHVEEFTGMNC